MGWGPISSPWKGSRTSREAGGHSCQLSQAPPGLSRGLTPSQSPGVESASHGFPVPFRAWAPGTGSRRAAQGAGVDLTGSFCPRDLGISSVWGEEALVKLTLRRPLSAFFL